VQIVKFGSMQGEQATVQDPDWTGRVKVTLDVDGDTKSYLAHELEHLGKIEAERFQKAVKMGKFHAFTATTRTHLICFPAAAEWKPGDRVKVIKIGTQTGNEGTIDDPNWAGRVKVMMDEGGVTKSYLAHELEHTGKKEEESSSNDDGGSDDGDDDDNGDDDDGMDPFDHMMLAALDACGDDVGGAEQLMTAADEDPATFKKMMKAINDDKKMTMKKFLKMNAHKKEVWVNKHAK
jgi:hypothetical protein